jgi:hypothetical protein
VVRWSEESDPAQVNESSSTTFVRISGLRGCLLMVRPQITTVYRNEESRFCVLGVKVSEHRDEVTNSGSLPIRWRHWQPLALSKSDMRRFVLMILQCNLYAKTSRCDFA